MRSILGAGKPDQLLLVKIPSRKLKGGGSWKFERSRPRLMVSRLVTCSVLSQLKLLFNLLPMTLAAVTQ